MSKRVTGPEILQERVDFMDSKSIWYFIDTINQGLLTNPVTSGGQITVTIQYNLSDHLVEQLRNQYLASGWEEVNIVLTGNEDSLYGTTEITFIPPDDVYDNVVHEVEDNL